MSTAAKALFTEVYGDSPNFMTPDVIRYGMRSRFAYELSEGEGWLTGERVYGVTVLESDGTKRHDLNGSFYSLDEAKAYISRGFSA